MKKQEEKQIINIDEFDSTVSLYQLMPSSAGRGLSHLKLIVDSILNNPKKWSDKPMSLLILGKQETRTHARAFTRALGLESINESPAHLLNAPVTAMSEFMNPLISCDCFMISDVNLLLPSVMKVLYQSISKGKYSINSYGSTKEIVAVYNPVIMTASSIGRIPKYLKEKIDHIVTLEDYVDQQLELIVLQRLKYCQIDYEEEKVLSLLVAYGQEDLQMIIRLLKDSITVMLSDSRKVLTVADVKRVMGYS